MPIARKSVMTPASNKPAVVRRALPNQASALLRAGAVLSLFWESADFLGGMRAIVSIGLDYKNQALYGCRCTPLDCELLCTQDAFCGLGRAGESQIAYAFDNVSNGLIGNKSLLHKGLAASIQVKS
jgi:hypothetical protein